MQSKLIAITSGEPAGIGPDICALIAGMPHSGRLVFLGDPDVIATRARVLGLELAIELREDLRNVEPHAAGTMQVMPLGAAVPVTAGRLDARNAHYVLEMIARGTDACLAGEADALVTAPVQKCIITQAGIEFSGHTEFLAERTRAKHAVMLLTDDTLRVALATTHVPLRLVAERINASLLTTVLEVLDEGLQSRFGIAEPRLVVLGLNPHAGESGTLGNEEREIIEPALDVLRARGLRLGGPVPADTAFTAESLAGCDAVLAMYHDQGLPALKARGFGQIVNVTLGLPIIRTSVDHGTALPLAGTGRARPDSLLAALRLALRLSSAVQRQ
jgi:4-hydroxythreonine-4-phosphate dehydrogenase